MSDETSYPEALLLTVLTRTLDRAVDQQEVTDSQEDELRAVLRAGWPMVTDMRPEQQEARREAVAAFQRYGLIA